MSTELNCYNVTCADAESNVYNVGVLAINEDVAKAAAVDSLLTGKHITATAIDIQPAETI